MAHITCTDLRQNLTRYMDEAVRSGEPIVVTRQSGRGNVVFLSESEFESWKETVYLMRNPANARRLLASIKPADAGEDQSARTASVPSPATDPRHRPPLTPPRQAGTPNA